MRNQFELERRLRWRTRGFTLVELMVSLVGGLFVAMALFTLAKHSSRFAMQQSRMADSTMQTVVGFERLRQDISRAGFLTTPNMVDDPRLCRSVAYPPWMARMASIYIEPVPLPQLSSEFALNGLGPQRVVLTGSYVNGNEFAVDEISVGPPVQIFLQPKRLGMAEIGYPSAPTAATLGRVFQTGRVLRLLDRVGKTQFAVIDGVTGGVKPSITLAVTPALQFRSGSGVGCGVQGLGYGMVVNPVNIIRYDVRNLNVTTEPSYAPMFRGGPNTDATRRELIREELDPSGNPIADTQELIAEYAVDLGFSLVVSRGNLALDPVDPADVSDYAGTPGALGVGFGPQRIRGVRFWLSTRSQDPDRGGQINYAQDVPGPGALRMSLHPTDPSKGPFARVRTLQSMVPLNNQATVLW